MHVQQISQNLLDQRNYVSRKICLEVIGNGGFHDNCADFIMFCVGTMSDFSSNAPNTTAVDLGYDVKGTEYFVSL
jgi:hypothetical protein